jgi:hypothetical protein
MPSVTDSTSTVKPLVLKNLTASSDSTKTDSTYVKPIIYPVGVYNPKPTKEKKEPTSFGITPVIIPDQNRNGGTVGANIALWPLMVKDKPDKGVFDIGLQNRMGNSLTSGKTMLSKDFIANMTFDPGMCTVGKFNNDLAWLGELQIRPVVDLMYGSNGENKTSRFEAFGSLAIGLSNPLQSKSFSLIKYIGSTFAYSGTSVLGGTKADVLLGDFQNYGEASDKNLYLKTEILLAPKAGTSFFDYADIYIKNNLGGDPFNPYITSREKFRAGGLFGFDRGRGTFAAEVYKSPSYYAGDPSSKKVDLDAAFKYKIVDWDNRKSGENKKAVAISLGTYSTSIFGWLNKGYNRPPIGVSVTVDVNLGWGHIAGSVDQIIKNKKVKQGPSEQVKPGLQTVTAQWDGISVDMAGGPYQTTKTVRIDVNDKSYASTDPKYKPKITISAGNVNYQIRSLKTGPDAIGENALTTWQDGNTAPASVYIRSVKLIDNAHNQIFGLDESGSWIKLTGAQPATPPELSTTRYAVSGGSRDFTFPADMWKSLVSDGRVNVSVIVEYGVDLSKSNFDINALKKYTSGNNRVLVWDPNEGVMDVYNNRVRWDGYHMDDNNRIYVDPYDPTQPNDPNTNPYYVGLKELAPITVGSTLNY